MPDSDDAQEALDQPDVANDSSDIQHGDNDNPTKMPLPGGTNHDGKIIFLLLANLFLLPIFFAVSSALLLCKAFRVVLTYEIFVGFFCDLST